MKHILTIFIASLIVFSGCKRGEEPKPVVENQYLVDQSNVGTVTSQQTKAYASYASFIYPELSPLISDFTYDVAVYTITYKTKFKNEDIIASGVVCIPVAEKEFSIMSFQNGTKVHHQEASSIQAKDIQSFDPLLKTIAAAGYIVVIADGIGFGASTKLLHPYHHRETSDAAVINMIRAAKELLNDPAISSTTNNRLFLSGYSQGGWATMSALQTIETKKPFEDVSVVAASCGAGAYSLQDMAEYLSKIDKYENPFYPAYLIESYRRNGFLNDELSIYFKEPYASNIPALYDGQHTSNIINENLTNVMKDLFSDKLLTSFSEESFFQFRSVLTENSINAWDVKAKLRMYHGANDLDVPILTSENMLNQFGKIPGIADDQVVLYKFNDLDHGTASIPWVIETYKWFKELN